MSKSYKIKKLRELVQAKVEAEMEKALELTESAEVEHSDTDSMSVMPDPEPAVEVEPDILCQPYTEPRPPSLEGISSLDLRLLAVDGLLTPTEQSWCRKKNMTHEPVVPPKFQWMLFCPLVV
jgi:hypothetical protein